MVCLGLAATAAYAQKIAIPALKLATLTRPVVKPATNITSNGFTANWEPVEGAEAYCVFV